MYTLSTVMKGIHKMFLMVYHRVERVVTIEIWKVSVGPLNIVDALSRMDLTVKDALTDCTKTVALRII